MEMKNQTIIIVICYFISFIYIRGFLYGIKRYQLNKSAYKKRKKGESFKEWLFYSRYIKEIPKSLYILYCFVLFIHPACLIVCAIIYFIGSLFDFGEAIAMFIAGFDVLWVLVISLLFWRPGRDYAYERWIKKNQ